MYPTNNCDVKYITYLAQLYYTTLLSQLLLYLVYTHTLTYQTKALKTSRYPLPGCNEKPGRREVVSRWKYVLKLVSNSLYQGNIGCLPVEKVSTPPQVKVFPVRSNQRGTEEWECTNEGAGEGGSEGEDSVGVHLYW